MDTARGTHVAGNDKARTIECRPVLLIGEDHLLAFELGVELAFAECRGIRSSSRVAPHRPDFRTARYLQFAGQLKAETLIDRDVAFLA